MKAVIIARFKGTDESLGYIYGISYELVIEGNVIVKPFPCPYESIATFLHNWQII